MGNILSRAGPVESVREEEEKKKEEEEEEEEEAEGQETVEEERLKRRLAELETKEFSQYVPLGKILPFVSE